MCHVLSNATVSRNFLFRCCFSRPFHSKTRGRRLASWRAYAGVFDGAFRPSVSTMWRSALHNAAHKPVGGDAYVEARVGQGEFSDVPTPSTSRVTRDTRRDARDALELFVSVYNLPDALAKRNPRLFVALLVEAPPDIKPPTHRSARRLASTKKLEAEMKNTNLGGTGNRMTMTDSTTQRHTDWVVAGVTEPLSITQNTKITRFCVPVRLDGLAGKLDHAHYLNLNKKAKRTVLALFRIPDDDDADDVFVAADFNLPMETRGAISTKRLGQMQYLGETSIDLCGVLQNISNRAGVDGKKSDRAVRAHYGLVKNPIRNVDAGFDSPLKGNTDENIGAIPNNDRKHTTLTTRNNPIGIEILAAVPLVHPVLPPRETGRVVCDFLVTFDLPSLDFFKTIDDTGQNKCAYVQYVFIRLLRWVGDGYQPVYSSLVTGAEDGSVEPYCQSVRGDSSDELNTKNNKKPRRFVARVPTMHVPVSCLRGGGGSSFEPGCMLNTRINPKAGANPKSPEPVKPKASLESFAYPLPADDAPWRIEIVARLSNNTDALLGSIDTTPGELQYAGLKAQSGDGPVSLKCDETVPNDHDFQIGSQAVVANSQGTENKTVLLLERWTVRAGSRARAGVWPGSSMVKQSGINPYKVVGRSPKRPSVSKAHRGAFDSSEDDDDSSEAESIDTLEDDSKTQTPQKKKKTPPKKLPRPPTPSDSETDYSYSSDDETKDMLYIASPSKKLVTNSPYEKNSEGFSSKENTPKKIQGEIKNNEKETVMTPTRLLLERRAGRVRTDTVEKFTTGYAYEMGELGTVSMNVRSQPNYENRTLGVRYGDVPNDVRAKVNSKEKKEPPPVADAKFHPDPELVKQADDAVREVVSHRLQGEHRSELIDSALRIRRELLKKLTGELRYLEQRQRRESRVGIGVAGVKRK